MSVLILDALHLSGERVLPAEQVQAMDQLQMLDASLRQCHVQARKRLAARLRRARVAARRVGHRQGRLAGMREVAVAFAEDVRRWRDVGARIEQAVATVLQDAALALPKTLLMEMQLRKCFDEVRDTPELRVHVNAAMYQPVQAVVREWIDEARLPACEVLLTEYLPDGACMLETAHGMFEGQVERELAVFCEQVIALLSPDGPGP